MGNNDNSGNLIEKTLSKQENKVLIVDDDPHLLRLFSYNFQKAGFEVKTAADGEAGLKAAIEFTPDIIVSDIMMPNVDGYQFRRLLLGNPDLRSIPFVFLSAKGDEQDILDGYDLEIEEYIVKTSGPKIIVAKVAAILKAHEKEKSKLFTEIHNAADSLRTKVVPDEFPEFQGFRITHWHVPYKGIPGGDFIDYFRLDEDRLAVVLGDVMGKRWGAWFFAVAYAGYIRSVVRTALQSVSGQIAASEVLQKINESIYNDTKFSEVFATLSIIIIDRRNAKAKYSGAGDLPVVSKKASQKAEQKKSHGLLLGFSKDGGFDDIQIDLSENGDCLFILTDGMIESRNSSGEAFGMERLVQLIDGLNPGDDPLLKIQQELNDFTGGNFDDDTSMVVVTKVI